MIACVLTFFPMSVIAGAGLCQGVPFGACDTQNTNTVTVEILPKIAKFLLEVAVGLSVLFIVWGGILMLISMGDDAKTTQAKWAIVYALMGLFGAILSQVFVGIVAETPLVGDDTAASIIHRAVKILVNAMNVIFLSVIIFAGIRMLMGHGQPEGFDRAKKAIMWAIAGAVIVNVARTLVGAVLTVFGV